MYLYHQRNEGTEFPRKKYFWNAVFANLLSWRYKKSVLVNERGRNCVIGRTFSRYICTDSTKRRTSNLLNGPQDFRNGILVDINADDSTLDSTVQKMCTRTLLLRYSIYWELEDTRTFLKNIFVERSVVGFRRGGSLDIWCKWDLDGGNWTI